MKILPLKYVLETFLPKQHIYTLNLRFLALFLSKIKAVAKLRSDSAYLSDYIIFYIRRDGSRCDYSEVFSIRL
jgi:hypothetical protein